MDLDEEIKIRKPREIVVDQIQFKKKISVGQNIFEYPISYHTRKLIIQTPIVYIPYSTYKVNNKITFDFYFLNLDVDRDMFDLKQFVENIDRKAIEKIKCDKSLTKTKNNGKIAREFISNIKKAKTGCMSEKPDKMRVSLYDNILAFDDVGKNISLDYLRYKTYLKLLLTPTKIWVSGNKYGVFWEVLQIKIYPKTVLNKYMFIDDWSLQAESTTDQLSIQTSSSSLFINSHPKFNKYFDMLKKGVPKGAVKNRMLMDNVDPNVLDMPRNSISSNSIVYNEAIPPPPPPPPTINFKQNNSINIMLTNSPQEEVPSMNAVFAQIKRGDTVLRKTIENKKHFNKSRGKTKRNSFVPSLDQIINARSSLKKTSNN